MANGSAPHDIAVKPLNHLTDGEPESGPFAAVQGPPMGLDPTDLQILVLLLRDARRSVRGIAAEVRMSAPAVAERIARLERHGVIRGYRAEIDWSRLGYGLLVYIRVTGVQGSEQAATVAELRRLPEVEQVEVVTGDSDLLVRLRARDQQHLRELLFERVWRISGIERTETLLCLGELPPKSFDLELAESLLDQSDAHRTGPADGTPSPESGRSV
ncbi:MAG: Lrp/AsnC family transcriptional regulator [Candidatus Dormiibacterota bacterium]